MEHNLGIWMVMLLLHINAHSYIPFRPQIQQGIMGNVYLQQGNRMPMKGIPRMSSGKGVSCELYVYTPVSLASAVNEGSTITNLPNRPIIIARSDSTGYFSITLPEGKYSVLIKWQQNFYFTYVDDQGYMNSIEITKHRLLKQNFIIRAHSTY